MNVQLPRYTWLPPVVLFGAILMSLSFSLRFYREEGDRLSRLNQSLAEIRDMRETLSPSPSESEGRVPDPLEDLSPVLVATLQSNGPVEQRDIGAGWIRTTSSYSISSLPPHLLGKLLEALQKEERGWWVTGLTLDHQGEGLVGQLRLEALDKGPVEE